ncbi:MAG: paraquat-inducible protein A [Pseudomonadota bacterium]
MSIGENLERYVACHNCDLLHHRVDLDPGATARCRRCGTRLYGNRAGRINQAFALTLASVLFFLLANAFPFLGVEVQGARQEISALSAAVSLFERDLTGLGLFAMAVIFIFPLIQLAGMLAVLGPLSQGRPGPMARRALRAVSTLAPWNMVGIYLLGVLISLVKISAMANVTLGIAFWAFVALVACNLWAAFLIDRDELWQQLETAA